MLFLENITKHYADTTALTSLSLDVGEGRTTVLIGPSGCGKSTILRIITGLVTADQGRVLFRGEAITPASLNAIRRRIGYVIQDGGLFPHLSARDNITIMACHLDWLDSTIAERLRELCDLVKLQEDMLDRFPMELSGGQRQRVGLMRALMLDPELLLLDEPLAALDPMIRYELQGDLRAIFRSLDKTVLFVTHDMGEAGFLADNIVLLRDGVIVQQGSYTELDRQPADEFVRRFMRAQRTPASEVTA